MEKLSRLGSHLSYTQKLAALGRLTAGVAHEIKNPLNAMAIHVALLRQKLDGGNTEARGYLDVLDDEIRRLDRVIQDS
jgi:signal transduction histidine kinase